MAHPRYAPHVAFAAPAGRGPLWRVVAMLLIFEVSYSALPYLATALLPPDAAEAYLLAGTRWGALGQLGSIGLVGLVFLSALRRLEGRGLESLLGPRDRLWRWGARAALAGLAVLALQYLAPPWIDTGGQVTLAPLLPWLALLPLGLAVLVVQVGVEEVVFRGYLQQELAARWSSPLVWMGVPSVWFGLAHLAAGEGPADAAAYAIWAGALGLACADLTARSGSLGPAIGLHLANNAVSVLAFGEAGAPFAPLALVLFPPWTPAPEDLPLDMLWSAARLFDLAVQLLSLLALWLAARVAIRA